METGKQKGRREDELHLDFWNKNRWNCSTLGLEVAQIARIVERPGEASKGWDKFHCCKKSPRKCSL